jgi:beta-1,4-mannosyl-glycoprotein beta-1,4-N-acetylglucosaminyltransferase
LAALPPTDAPNAWSREFHQRDSLAELLWDVGPDDLVLVSDVDEIPNEILLAQVRAGWSQLSRTVLHFEQELAYFRANFVRVASFSSGRIISPKWWGPVAVPGSYGLSPQAIRSLRIPSRDLKFENQVVLKNAGWHLSYLGDDHAFQRKIESMRWTPLFGQKSQNLGYGVPPKFEPVAMRDLVGVSG